MGHKDNWDGRLVGEKLTNIIEKEHKKVYCVIKPLSDHVYFGVFTTPSDSYFYLLYVEIKCTDVAKVTSGIFVIWC